MYHFTVQYIDDRSAQADSLLAPYAVKHSEGLGRLQKEVEDDTRLRFQRDRGRIVHTQEFRRLKGKTQVFVGPSFAQRYGTQSGKTSEGKGGGDHFRTRLTHTMEVAGISRDIARALNLNEDLAECIALAHDLGHPPFGHAGEEAIDVWMKKHDSQFEHNQQSYRIVTLLSEHSALFKGLNLNQEILEGLLKHRTPHDQPSPSGLRPTGIPESTNRICASSIEAQIVNIADEIAYSAHDCEDGLQAQLFDTKKLSHVPLAKEAYEISKINGTSLRGALINLLVTDLYQATESELTSQRITTLEDVYAAKNPIVTFSESMRSKLEELRQFLWDHMYNHPAVLEVSGAGKAVLQSLCEAYINKPTDKVKSIQKRTGDTLHESVKDYVAGMTDGYAFLQAGKLKLITPEIASALSYS